MTSRSILLATDLSANSAFAARWAQQYAQLTGSNVILAHIIEINVPNWLRDAYSIPEDAEKRARMETKLKDWYTEHTGAEAGDVVLAAGNIDQKLVQLVEQTDADMLVLAKSGKGAITRFLAGSTAQMMAATPPCPVAIVHPDHTKLTSDTKLAVATDLTESAEAALTSAALMANALGGHLDIVHANSDASSSEDHLSGEAQSADAAALHERAEAQLAKVIEGHQAHLKQVAFATHVIDAHPVDAVTQFAEDNATNVVIVGNAASYNVLTNVFGRVSVKLMQTLSCTFLVIPPDATQLEDVLSP